MSDHFERPASNRYGDHFERHASHNGWEDHHRRTEIVHTVLTRAAIDPASPDLFAEIPELDRLFGGPEGLLLALRYRWNIHLDAKLDQALVQGQSTVEAYLELAAEQPVLRAVLDAQYRRRVQAAEAMAR
ncbi:hypothetical protein [Nocardia pseudovaccinii]|uniref:hypothetical protein n=1 Tax=Nocardia pseudovaccinii TaxID=189540 RepID=UPI000A9D4A1D|nr:hypothetical protein [Nocardia pseudovaccinii]